MSQFFEVATAFDSMYWFDHGRITEKDWQLIGLFKNIRDLAIMIFQRIPLNHYMPFNLNDLKVLEH